MIILNLEKLMIAPIWQIHVQKSGFEWTSTNVVKLKFKIVSQYPFFFFKIRMMLLKQSLIGKLKATKLANKYIVKHLTK